MNPTRHNISIGSNSIPPLYLAKSPGMLKCDTNPFRRNFSLEVPFTIEYVFAVPSFGNITSKWLATLYAERTFGVNIQSSFPNDDFNTNRITAIALISGASVILLGVATYFGIRYWKRRVTSNIPMRLVSIDSDDPVDTQAIINETDEISEIAETNNSTN